MENIMTDYKVIRAEVEAMLQDMGITYEIRLIGDSCPVYCGSKGLAGIGVFPRKTHIHGQHYQLTLIRVVNRTPVVVLVDYWNSYHDAELKALGDIAYRRGERVAHKGKVPKVTVADVLACCEFSVPGTFEEWAEDFVYDTDSRKAEDVYKRVHRQVQDFRRMFAAKELDTIAAKVREL